MNHAPDSPERAFREALHGPVEPLPPLNDDEQIMADALWKVYDYFCRIHFYPENPHYVWDKMGQLGNAATQYHRIYASDVRDEDGTVIDGDETHDVPDTVDVARVRQWVAVKIRRQFTRGDRLFPQIKETP